MPETQEDRKCTYSSDTSSFFCEARLWTLWPNYIMPHNWKLLQFLFFFIFLSFFLSFRFKCSSIDILCEKLVGNFILSFNCSISAIRFCIKCIYHLPRANIPRFYIVKGLPKRLIIYLCFLILLLLFNLGAWE